MSEFVKPVEEVIRLRKSVRTFEAGPIPEKELGKIKKYISSIDNPFEVPVRIHIIEDQGGTDGRKLGTYGIIHGAAWYLGAAVPDGPLALEALGYSFEKLLLLCTTLGLGTCWLGGTFNRASFAQAMKIRSGELFPAVSPIGYPKEKQGLVDFLVRSATKGDKRKPWDELFFLNSFPHPLSETDAGRFKVPLEMVRLGPSASNKQPWRILKSGGAFHFFEEGTPGYGKAFAYDLQRIDLGIAACHFDLSAMEEGLKGTFRVLEVAPVIASKHLVYVFSWIPAPALGS